MAGALTDDVGQWRDDGGALGDEAAAEVIPEYFGKNSSMYIAKYSLAGRLPSTRSLVFLGWAAIIFLTHLFVFSELLTPYYPVPSDDASFRQSVEGEMSGKHRLLLLLVIAFRVAMALAAVLPTGWLASTYDAMLLTSHLLHFGAALVLSLTLRRYTNSLLWPVLGLLGFVVASWTNVYAMFISHASFAAFFVSLGVNLIFRLRDQAFTRCPEFRHLGAASHGRTEAPILLTGLSVTTVCLMLSTPAGPFWAASLLVLLTSVFAASFISLSLNRGWVAGAAVLGNKVTARNLRTLAKTQIPFVPLGFFLIVLHQRYLRVLEDNLDSFHYADATEILGISDFTVPFLSVRMLFFHLPILCLFLVALTGAWLLWRRPWRADPAGRWTVIAALLATLVVTLVASDLHGFTKLGRHLFPFFSLMLLTTLLLAADLMGALGQRRWATATVIAGFLAFTAFHVARTAVNYEARYGLTHFLMAQGTDANIYLLVNDSHAVWIEQAVPRQFHYVAAPTEIPLSRSGKTILVIGPRGKGSGLSLMRHATLRDFTPEHALLTPPPGVRELRFPYYVYLSAFLQEEEISQMLYFRGLMPEIDDAEKQVIVWILE